MASQQKKKGSAWTKYIIIAVLVVGVGGFIINSLPESGHTPSKNIDVNTSKPKNVRFKKEGTIDFYRMSGEKVTSIDVEIAETQQERSQGLMHRHSMEGEHGMLFVYENERPQSFWMKNTYIPLDIIFINKDFRIVDQYLGAKPKSTKSIESRRAATYVLEVNAGFCRAYNIGPGMTVELNRF
ncbi:MAG: DUF192 domain-containing protein [Saprospiraceae bacterium]|nr:DUF192 domain-containing protein [Saprospiraceae bacterium]